MNWAYVRSVHDYAENRTRKVVIAMDENEKTKKKVTARPKGQMTEEMPVLALRGQERDILLECARPCEPQADSWPAAERARYQSILDRCDFETLVQPRYDRFCMLRRNRYMVDRSSRLIAVYNGVPKGGTFQTLTYAIKGGLAIHTIDLEDFCQ